MKIRWGIIFVIIYAAAVGYVYSSGLNNYLHLLTSPWSFVLEMIADYYNARSDNFILLNVILSTICNSAVLYLIGLVFERRED